MDTKPQATSCIYGKQIYHQKKNTRMLHAE